jgi:hypothetical protein
MVKLEIKWSRSYAPSRPHRVAYGLPFF